MQKAIISWAAITTIIERLNCTDVYVSCAGLREGIIYEHIEPQLAVKAVPSALDFSLKNLSGLYNENEEHAKRVAQLSLSMFEQLRQLHKLPNSYARIVKAAGMLHDIGLKIRYYDHHRHTFYMMLNCNLYGFNHHDRLMAAFIAEFHRKEEPKKDYIKYADILSGEDIEIINKMGVLLRIAESFDRCMSGVVTNVSCDILGDSVIVKTNATMDATLEIKDALTSSTIFKKAYGITPHQYILQSRMRLAMVLLKTTDESIEAIAEKLGFSDAHHFSTQFRRLLSYQPSQYRNIDRKPAARYNGEKAEKG